MARDGSIGGRRLSDLDDDEPLLLMIEAASYLYHTIKPLS
jgi:hypothetical protein